MLQPVKNIVIVGGGTSAWFTAAYLNHNHRYNITLVDKEVGTPVGVGEGTLLNFNDFMANCGITTTEYFNEIDAIFKSGILFPNWGKKDNLVWHPFWLDEVYKNESVETSVYESWTHHQDEYDFTEIGAHWHSSLENKVDVTNIHHYAMHVDAGKITLFLQKRLEKDITIIKSEVVDVLRQGDNVQKIILENGSHVDADLYIDCTGWANVLQDNIDKVNLEGRLFCDTAIAAHVPYEDMELERKPYVTSEAVDLGWIWNIPTQSRIGSGLVFNRDVTDTDRAKQYFCDYWDHRIKLDQTKVLRWDPFYIKNPWQGNVVSIGLSAGFIEPLESTGLGLTMNAIKELSIVLKAGFYTQKDQELFNTVHQCIYEDSIDFINMHYTHTEFDTPFWNFVKQTNIGSERLKYFEENIASGNAFHIDGRGFMFGGANWLCWMLQTYNDIPARKTVDPSQARRILDDWVDKQNQPCMSLDDAIDHIGDIL